MAGELVTAALMNTHIRDNENVLKTPITDGGSLRLPVLATTTSTGSDYAHDIATDTVIVLGGDVTVKLATATASSTGRQVLVKNNGSGTVTYYGADLAIDGSTSTSRVILPGDSVAFLRFRSSDWIRV